MIPRSKVWAFEAIPQFRKDTKGPLPSRAGEGVGPVAPLRTPLSAQYQVWKIIIQARSDRSISTISATSPSVLRLFMLSRRRCR